MLSLEIKKSLSAIALTNTLILSGCSQFKTNKENNFDEVSKAQSLEENIWVSNTKTQYSGTLEALSKHFRRAKKLKNIKYPTYRFSFDKISNTTGQSFLPYDITNSVKHRFHQIKNTHIKINDITVESLKRDVFILKNIQQLAKENNIVFEQKNEWKSIPLPDLIIVGGITAADDKFTSASVKRRGDIDIGKGRGQSDSIYTVKEKGSYSKFIVNLQAQRIPTREPLSSVEMTLILKKSEGSDGFSVSIMGNGFGYNSELTKGIGAQESILSLLDITVFELVRKLYSIPPLISEKPAIIKYYGDDFESQAMDEQVSTIQTYLNVVEEMLSKNKTKKHQNPLKITKEINKETRVKLRNFYDRAGKKLGLSTEDLAMDTLSQRKGVFISLVLAYSKITLHGKGSL